MYTPSISVDSVIDALADFIAPFAPGAEIVRAQVNRVSMPASPCVILTDLSQADLSVPFSDPNALDGTLDITGPTRIEIQVDFYGVEGGYFARAFATAYRTGWGFDRFPATVKPLYTSDPTQGPLTTAEKQYESRWTLTAALQYNPTVTVPQEFADVVAVNASNPADLL